MSIQSCELIGHEYGYLIGGVQQHTQTYRIVTDGYTLGEHIAREAHAAGTNPLPVEGSLFDASGVAICTEIRLRQEQESNFRRWIATVIYGERSGDEEEQPPDPTVPPNPLQRATEWRLDWETVTEPIETDRNGSAIVNSAGQPFTEVPVDERRLTTWVAEKNFETLEEIADLDAEYDRAVNSVEFLGRGPRQVKYAGCSASEAQWENGVRFFRASFRFVVKPETWDRKILDKGLMIREGGELERAKDIDEQAVVEEVLLDGAGKQLPIGQLGIPLTFQCNPLKDLNGMDL